MLNRLLFIPFTALALFFAGCGSKPELVLHKPGETQVWKTRTTSGPSTSDNPMVKLSTSFGDITVELFEEQAPISVANFLAYVESGFFEGTLFHRVIPGFMIQGGGFNLELVEKPTNDPIQNEAGNGLKNLRGTLAMARTSDLNSATSQFYINLVNNAFLNGDGVNDGYAVFGRVYDGMAVVDEIGRVATEKSGEMSDVPVEPVVIERVTRIQ